MLKHLIEKARRKVEKDCNIIRGRVAAIAVVRGSILAVETNRRCDKKKWTWHAEEMLLRKLVKIRAKERLGKISVYVLRFNHMGLALAKPCPACEKKLRKYGVEDVYYTTFDCLWSKLGGI